MRTNLIMAVLAIAAVLAVLGWVYRKGSDGALIGVERQNNAAASKSDRARSSYDDCVERGGLYDFGSGKCRRP
ncbi:MAG TPA: hypothetical protein VGO22_01120 [Pseudorhizobium sp.]|jgi:phage-related protein|nr:hypothetical protein [Pseudorhizobium sp.]